MFKWPACQRAEVMILGPAALYQLSYFGHLISCQCCFTDHFHSFIRYRHGFNHQVDVGLNLVVQGVFIVNCMLLRRTWQRVPLTSCQVYRWRVDRTSVPAVVVAASVVGSYSAVSETNWLPVYDPSQPVLSLHIWIGVIFQLHIRFPIASFLFERRPTSSLLTPLPLRCMQLVSTVRLCRPAGNWQRLACPRMHQLIGGWIALVRNTPRQALVQWFS